MELNKLRIVSSIIVASAKLKVLNKIYRLFFIYARLFFFLSVCTQRKTIAIGFLSETNLATDAHCDIV